MQQLARFTVTGRLLLSARRPPAKARMLSLVTIAGIALSAPGHSAITVAGPGMAGPKWARAVEIRPPADAGLHPDASLLAVSCPAAGSCVAGGQYLTRSGSRTAMIAAELRGRWRQARAVLLPANAGRDPEAAVSSISCPRDGYCVAVGSYLYGQGHAHLQGFIATQTRGRWHRADSPVLPSNAPAIHEASLLAVSCTSVGSCTTAGWYVDRAGQTEIMIAAESGGRWHRARELLAPAGARANPDAMAFGLACPAAGSCALVGGYADSASHLLPLAATEAGGHWGAAFEARLPPNPFGSPGAWLNSVTCSTAAACVAVGRYQDSLGAVQAMALATRGRLWGRGVELERAVGAAVYPDANLLSVSCARASACVAVGGYRNVSGHTVAMVAPDSGGRWGQPSALATPPHSGTAGHQEAYLESVSCISHGACVAVGFYADATGTTLQAMAATRPAR